MRLIDELKYIDSFEYCVSHEFQHDDYTETMYQFGWKGGFHFYLSEYEPEDEHGKFLLNVYFNKEQLKGAMMIKTLEEVKSRIFEIIKDMK